MTTDLVGHVSDLVSRVRQGVYPTGSDVVPVGFPVDFVAERTFVTIPVPSSLLPSRERIPTVMRHCAETKNRGTARILNPLLGRRLYMHSAFGLFKSNDGNCVLQTILSSV